MDRGCLLWSVPREADRIMSGTSCVVAIWVTHPPCPTSVPRSSMCSPEAILRAATAQWGEWEEGGE
jgi:hypothetical protein